MKKFFLDDIKIGSPMIVFKDYAISTNANKLLTKNINQNKMYNFLAHEHLKSKNYNYSLLHMFHNDWDFDNWASHKKMNPLEFKQYISELSLKGETIKTNSFLEEDLYIGFTNKAVDNVKYYNIDEVPSLYTELAKLEVYDLKSLLKFVKTFGLPTGLREELPFEIEEPYIVNDEHPITFWSASIPAIYFELVVFKRIFHIFKLIRTENHKELKEILVKNDGWKIFNNLSEKEELQYIKKSSAFLFISYFGRIDSHPINISLGINETKIRPNIIFDDLFHAAYFQLMTAMNDEVKLKKCKHCGHHFEVDNENRQFCYPLPFRKRSSCEMAHYREVKKKQKEGDL